MFFQMKIKQIDQARVEAAIENFEKEIDFEFIPVIAHRSSYVEHITVVLSLLFMVLLIGGIEVLFQTYLSDSWMPHWPFYVAAPFVSFVVGFILDKSDRIDRFFITPSERARQVQAAAELFYFRERLHEVKSSNALLLYISVMERQIVLMPDPRHKFEGMEQLTQGVLQKLQTSFKKGDFETGLLESIELLQKTLANQFKRTEVSANNVPNKLIWLDDRLVNIVK
jgi:uncharacterized membrane protein